jgi:hypothetical protein
MPVHIDEMVSEVSADAPTPPGSATPAPEWQELARMRELHAQNQRDQWRTAAEHFDD